MKKGILYILLVAAIPGIHAQEIVNLAFYNLLNYPQAPPSNRDQILSLLIDEMQPDIFMICELESENAGNDILDNSLNVSSNVYDVAPYINNTSSGANLQQLVYFNRDKFELEETTVIPTTIRDINRYRLKLRTEEDLFIEVFVTHLKASTGDANVQLRLDMVNEFTSYLEGIDPATPIIFAGDLNLYTSLEPAYQELLDPSNAIVLQDPINTPGDWNNDSSFATTHTQSTRISNNDFDNFGAGGGLDSRFDFILMSKNILETTAPISYVDNSYAAFGNNGNCFNNRIDDNDCGGQYSSTVRNLLYQMSDHVPVVAQLNVDATFLPPLRLEDIVYTSPQWFLSRTIVGDVLEIAFAPVQLPGGKANTSQTEAYIYDQTGRLIRTLKVHNQEELFSVADLSQGLYYINSNNPRLETLKFIKTID